MQKEQFLREKWVNFFRIIFTPGSVIPLVLATLVLYFAFYQTTGILSRFLSVFSAILTAIAGIFIKTDWDKMQGNTILEKKGRSTIRNLDSISCQINQIRNWIKNFISKKDSKKGLEEINRHLLTIDLNIKSGLEDWVDVVPELQKSKEVIKLYEDAINNKIEAILKNKAELSKTEDKELKGRLENKIKELEKEFKELKREPRQLLSHSIGDNAIAFTAFSPSSVLGNKICSICSICGKTYTEDYSHTYLASNICLECRIKRFGSDDPTSVILR